MVDRNIIGKYRKWFMERIKFINVYSISLAKIFKRVLRKNNVIKWTYYGLFR